MRRLWHLTEWADLDQPATPLTTSRNLCGPFQSFVQVFAIEDIEPRQLLLGLGVWAIGDHDFAVLHADSGRGDAGRKWFSATQNAATLRLIQQRTMSLGDCADCFGSHRLIFLRI